MKNSVLTTFAILMILSCNHSKPIFQENSKDWNAYGDANWNFLNDELTGAIINGAGFVMTKQTYTDFILELEFKPDSTINSGVFIRCKKEDINPTDCYELNIWDLHPDQVNRTGAIVTNTAPLAFVETINKWNIYKIKAKKNRIQVWINDILTADVKDNSLSEGYIGLQAKGTGEITFRKVKIESLEPD
jgi:hypothetical protein